MKEKSKGLVSGYLERIASDVFDDYHDEITELIAKRHGVYALYKRKHLHYVGLATNLRNRVKHHLRDRHKKKWDRFSLYLIEDVNYLRELESLIVHVSAPRGNRQLGRFARSENLKQSLRELIGARAKLRIENIFGKKAAKKGQKRKTRSQRISGKPPALKGLLPAGSELRVTFKGKPYVATVDVEGRISVEGQVFNSPSMAAIHITGGAKDGWLFWKYQDKDGNWVKLDMLRK
jgi:hypothetical protein